MLEKLTDDWNELLESNKIIIYGFGKVALDNLDYFINNFEIAFIVEGDKSKCNQQVKGIPVRYIEDVKSEIRTYKIIIMTGERNAKDVSCELNKLGLKENKDYCSMETFVSEWFWKVKKMACLLEVHTSITTRCTFKCRNCNMFMPYYKEQYDYTMQNVLDDLELLFHSVDYIFQYVILGGEPLLNRELPKMLQAIWEKYGEKIGKISIITNGSIVPDTELIAVSKKCNVIYKISDYTDGVPYKEKLHKVIETLHKSQIDYRVHKDLRWLDFGFPENKFCFEENRIRSHMLRCSPIFHGINDGKLYYCHVAWSAEKCGLHSNEQSDFIDLRKLEGNPQERKVKILEHCRGNMANGYVTLCKRCGGCGSDNFKFVRAGIQKND